MCVCVRGEGEKREKSREELYQAQNRAVAGGSEEEVVQRSKKGRKARNKGIA